MFGKLSWDDLHTSNSIDLFDSHAFQALMVIAITSRVSMWLLFRWFSKRFRNWRMGLSASSPTPCSRVWMNSSALRASALRNR